MAKWENEKTTTNVLSCSGKKREMWSNIKGIDHLLNFYFSSKFIIIDVVGGMRDIGT